MATTTTSNNRPKANDLDGTVREHAEASIKDVQDLAAATVDHTSEVTTALSRSALSVTRSSEVALKAWSAAMLPLYGRVDARGVLNAGFDMAGSVLDAQRQLAQRLVGAATPAAR